MSGISAGFDTFVTAMSIAYGLMVACSCCPAASRPSLPEHEADALGRIAPVSTTSRQELGASVSPTASSSVDGRRFTFQCSIQDLVLKAGGYASIDGRLGQVHAIGPPGSRPELVAAVTEEVADASHLRIALARGHGVVLDGDGRPFHESPIVRADTESVAGWLDRTRPRRASSTSASSSSARCALRARRR